MTHSKTNRKTKQKQKKNCQQEYSRIKRWNSRILNKDLKTTHLRKTKGKMGKDRKMTKITRASRNKMS